MPWPRAVWRPSVVCALVAIALTFLVVANEVVWIHLDTRLQPVGDEWVEKSLNLADGLRCDPITRAWRHLYWASLGPRVPLYPLLAVAPLWTFGRSVDSILLVNCASLLLLACATYHVAARMLDARAGLFATALALLNPIATHLVKLARPHVLIIATTALALAALYHLAFDRPSHRNVWFSAAALLLVFAAHAAGLAALLVPCVLACALFLTHLDRETNGSTGLSPTLTVRVRRVAASPIMRLSAYPAAFLLAALPASWLYVKWEQYQNLLAVVRALFVPKSPEWYYELTLHSALGTWSLVLFVVSAGGLLLFPSAMPPSARRGFWFVLLSLVGAFACSHFQTAGKSWNTFGGVVPMFAVLSAVASLSLSDWMFRRASIHPALRFAPGTLLIASLAGAGLTYAFLNWGSDEEKSPVAVVTGIHPRCTSPDAIDCPRPPIGGDWFVREMLDVMVRDPRCQPVPCQVAVLGHRQAYFSDEALAYSLVVYFPEASKLRSTRFYPERNLRFERVEGETSVASRQLSQSQFVVILQNRLAGRPELKNDYFPQEQAVSEEILRLAAAHAGQLSEVLRRTLPTGETLILVSVNPERAGSSRLSSTRPPANLGEWSLRTPTELPARDHS